MKSLLLALIVNIFNIPTYQISPTDRAPAEAKQCKYSLKDAQADLATLVYVDFIPQNKFPDGHKVMGLAIYRNPKNPNLTDIAAGMLVVRDDRFPDEELALFVMYDKGDVIVSYKREIKNNAIGLCFDKVIERKAK